MDDGPNSGADSLADTKSLPPQRGFASPSSKSANAASPEIPAFLRESTRFHVQRLLGRGAFGAVYLATDRQLSRSVALKVPRAERLSTRSERNDFLREAQAAAALRHPGIVTVFDIYDDEQGIFIVLEFVEGCTLSAHATKQRLSFEDIARLMIDVCRAVAYAHEHGLIHRDLKPSNILVDQQGKIRVTDFGLAIHERGQRFLAHDVVGTPAYMAPEQVRGETNRLDARTDIWSLGIVLHWLLTEKLPFDGRSEAEVFDEILNRELRPPRQIVAAIPRELERICVKCLAKRMSERPATSQDLADDLQHWLDVGRTSGSAITLSRPPSPPDSTETPKLAVVPKGLRSFDQHDSDFYLTLLPGPFDRHGIPESIRFWKQRIEERNAAETFSVGLMYGPSGCGKTSLVRAGILPRLGADVRWVYIEAAAEGTEQRLLRAVRGAFPELPAGLSLLESLVELRDAEPRGSPRKLFMVLDQFEQWLTGCETDENEVLIRALRHCDGGRLQCLVMVRDEFNMAATRFMNSLEVRMVEGHNCAAVDVFRRDHARRVLSRFGEAFGRFSPGSAEGELFVDQAVDFLSKDNTVAPVRLAAFAELMRHQDWNTSSLLQFGGSQGLGIALLEACLGDDSTNLTHRPHRQAARRLLEALLPEDRTSLKGRMRSQEELMEIVGYATRPRDFQALLDMLNRDLRLISPADPQQGDWEQSRSDSNHLEGSGRRVRYFQLAHDYLVPSLNAWLMGKQRETFAGRAMLMLDAIAAEWNSNPGPRRLPTLLEWGALRCMTKPRRWTSGQRRMMAAADRRHSARLAALCLVLTLLVVAVFQVRSEQRQQRQESQIHNLAEQLLVADVSRVPGILRELDGPNHSLALAALHDAAASPQRTPEELVRAQLFLANHHESARMALLPRLFVADPDEHQIIAARLAPFAETLGPALWNDLHRAGSSEEKLRLAAVLAAWDPDNSAWDDVGPSIADALAHSPHPQQMLAWIEALYPVRRPLTPTLAERYRDETSAPTVRFTAATVLVRFLHAETTELVQLAVDATPDVFPILFASLQRSPPAAVADLRSWLRLAESSPSSAPQAAAATRRRAVAVVALARLGSDGELWTALESETEPERRTAVIDGCRAFGLPAIMLIQNLGKVAPSTRHAALVALADYIPQLAPDDRTALREQSLARFESDEHAGVHAAAERLLRQLGETRELARLRQVLAARDFGPQQWLINRQGITLVAVRGPRETVYGSPGTELEREDIEPRQELKLDHSFAISSHEITVEQFRRYSANFPFASAVTTSPDCPVSNVNWLDAVKYCRWLSEQEDVPEEEMCYPAVDQIGPHLQLPDDWQRRSGYRLPTEGEWECACRAGTRTARFFGDSADHLDRYAVYIANSREKLSPVGSLRPNPWGLFDVYGNVLEWCQDLAGGPELRALRSGTYRSIARENRSAKRYPYSPDVRYSFLGFRVARSVPKVP